MRPSKPTRRRREPTLPDFIAPNLDVLFAASPRLSTAAVQQPSDSGNRFWPPSTEPLHAPLFSRLNSASFGLRIAHQRRRPPTAPPTSQARRAPRMRKTSPQSERYKPKFLAISASALSHRVRSPKLSWTAGRNHRRAKIWVLQTRAIERERPAGAACELFVELKRARDPAFCSVCLAAANAGNSERPPGRSGANSNAPSRAPPRRVLPCYRETKPRAHDGIGLECSPSNARALPANALCRTPGARLRCSPSTPFAVWRAKARRRIYPELRSGTEASRSKCALRRRPTRSHPVPFNRDFPHGHPCHLHIDLPSVVFCAG